MRILVIMLVILVSACKSKQIPTEKTELKNKVTFTPIYDSGPPVIVYKTRKDYQNNVPVMLSDDRKSIVWYPHPSDLRIENLYKTPVALQDNYLLDKQGISKNVAFLNISYKKYAELKEVPSLVALFELVIDANPLIEMCNCGVSSAFTDETSQINSLINQKEIRNICKIIK